MPTSERGGGTSYLPALGEGKRPGEMSGGICPGGICPGGMSGSHCGGLPHIIIWIVA